MQYPIHLLTVLKQVLPTGETARTLCGRRVVREHTEAPVIISQVTCFDCRKKHLELCRERWELEEVLEGQVQHG